MTATDDPLQPVDGDRIMLRRLTTSDVEDLYAIFSDPEVVRYWSSPAHASLDESRSLLSRIDDHAAKGDLYQWGVVERESGRVIGTTTLSDIDRSNRRAEIGFALARSHWRRGLMREAVGCLIAHAYDGLQLHRLEADIDPHNEASIKLVESLGFTREGYLPQRWFVHGGWHDTVLYGLLAPTWRERSAS